MLRNHDQARTVLRSHELAEVSRHGRLVMRDDDAAIACGQGEHVVVVEAGQAPCRGGFEVDGGTRLRTAATMIWFRSASA